jgi:hypothetical protein
MLPLRAAESAEGERGTPVYLVVAASEPRAAQAPLSAQNAPIGGTLRKIGCATKLAATKSRSD